MVKAPHLEHLFRSLPSAGFINDFREGHGFSRAAESP